MSKEIISPTAEEGLEKRHSVTILWRIENLSQWNTHSAGLYSSCFTVDTLNDMEVYLIVYPRGENSKDKHVRMRIYTDKTLSHPIDCEWCVLGSDQLPLYSSTLRDTNFLQDEEITLPLCPLQEEVFVTLKSLFLPKDTLTVRCRIWKSTGEHTPVEHISLLSRIEVREASFPWVIDVESLQLNQEIAAPINRFFKDKSEEVQLKLLLIGNSIQDSSAQFKITVPKQDDYSVIKLCVTPSPVLTKFNFEHIFCFNETYWNTTFVSRQELMTNMLTSFKRLILFCNLVYTYYTDTITNLDSEPSNQNEEIKNSTSIELRSQALEQNDELQTVPSETSNFDNLKGDFLFLYQEQTFSDFKLSSNDVSFPVHKCVLSARSPVFRSMFSSDMKESASNSLDVPDLDTHTLNRFLTFLYTGTVERLQWEDAAKLYYAADKYDVPFLKEVCTSTLRSSLAISNVCDILVLSDRHRDQQLTSNVHDFILGDFDEIMNSKEWESFIDKDPNFAGKTTHQLLKKNISYRQNATLNAR